MSSVLIVEDNENLAFGLRNNLEIAGHRVEVAGEGRTALRLIRERRPDLVVLDLGLPELDGYRVLQTIRGEGLTTPVIILTARSEEADKVLGFRLGADDYVTKPFSVLELIERVSALLRRAGGTRDQAGVPPRVVRFGDIEVDHPARVVTRRGRPVDLAPMEYGLLIAFLRSPGRVLSRVELLGEVWGHDAAVITRTVDTHVAELRRKLEDDPAHPRHIVTVRKAGYRFEP